MRTVEYTDMRFTVYDAAGHPYWVRDLPPGAFNGVYYYLYKRTGETGLASGEMTYFIDKDAFHACVALWDRTNPELWRYSESRLGILHLRFPFAVDLSGLPADAAIRESIRLRVQVYAADIIASVIFYDSKPF